MPKPLTLPPLLDSMGVIDISILYKKGLFKKMVNKAEGTINVKGTFSDPVPVSITYVRSSHIVSLHYLHNDSPQYVDIQIHSVPSNLGVGVCNFFECPITGKLCRKLYFYAGLFGHRSAHPGACYMEQTFSHRDRAISSMLAKDHYAREAKYKIRGKYFRKHYKGKETREYRKLARAISREVGVDLSDLLAGRVLI